MLFLMATALLSAFAQDSPHPPWRTTAAAQPQGPQIRVLSFMNRRFKRRSGIQLRYGDLSEACSCGSSRPTLRTCMLAAADGFYLNLIS
jgi:ribosomal protein L32